MLLGRRFPLRLKLTTHMSYVGPAMLYGSEAWCLKESEMEIFAKDRKIHDESNMWSTSQGQLKLNGFDVHAGFEGNY